MSNFFGSGNTVEAVVTFTNSDRNLQPRGRPDDS